MTAMLSVDEAPGNDKASVLNQNTIEYAPSKTSSDGPQGRWNTLSKSDDANIGRESCNNEYYEEDSPEETEENPEDLELESLIQTELIERLCY
jgi:hypothetical protein